MTENIIKIRSIHVIPFDIGIFIDSKKKELIEKNLSVFPTLPQNEFWKGVSVGLLLAKKIEDNIHLYIYQYGIGIFVIQDNEPYVTKEKYYATGFCEHRSQIHNDIYLNKFIKSEYISRIMKHIWDSLSKYKLRKTANNDWELNGILYVMTVDFLETSKPLILFDEIDKKNLYIILNPCLVGKEDLYSKTAIIENSQFINLSNDDLDPYKAIDLNLLYDHNKINDDVSFYVSWTTVLICQEEDKSSNKLRELFECLQVELQAFWFYTYILTEKMEHVYNYARISRLREILFDYTELEQRFLEIKLLKLPKYLADIWQNMLETSFLKSHILKTKRTLEHIIEQSEKVLQGYQYKYSKMNNILISVIAYIQIIPYLYKFFVGDYKDIQILPIISIILVLVAIIIVVWKKE